MKRPATINFAVKDGDWEIIQEILEKHPHFPLTTAIREALQAWKKLEDLLEDNRYPDPERN